MQKFNPKWIKFNLSISDTSINPAETGFYYLNSRYYNPEVGRFLNEDKVISGIGGELLGYNLYVYCFNNPVIMYDFEGTRPVVVCGRSMLAEEKNKEKTWVSSTFGKEHTINETKSEKIVPEPSPIVITIGNTTTTTTYKRNNSNPVVGYTSTNKDGSNLSSTIGARMSVSRISIDFSMGFDDIGITGAYVGDYSTKSIGVRLNVHDMKIGMEYSSTIQWDTDITNTTYTNVSISALGVLMAYALAIGYIPALQH